LTLAHGRHARGRRLAAVVGIGGLWLAGSVAAQSGGKSMGEKTVANVQILAKQAEFKAGEPVEVEAVLQNSGDQPLWVNKRLLLNSAFAPPPFREVSLDVRGPDEGQEVRFICKIRAGEALPKDYVVLKAGEKLSAPLPLKCFDLSKEGVYTVTAHYADGNPKVPPPPAGETHLSQPLTSSPVQIRIHR
jgi:hypothetical protein